MAEVTACVVACALTGRSVDVSKAKGRFWTAAVKNIDPEPEGGGSAMVWRVAM